MVYKKRGQVWIETVIYTLIALSLITTTLVFINPKIQEMKDSATLSKNLEMMQGIDSRINDIARLGSGNRRKIDMKIGRGELNVDGKEDIIQFDIKSDFKFSEEGVKIKDRRIIIETNEEGNKYLTSFTLNYTGKYNITFNGNDEVKKIPPSPTFYKLLVVNAGKTGNKTNIDIEIN